MAVAVHKTRAIFFGGVFDEDVSDERMVSVFYNDLCVFLLLFALRLRPE